MEQPRTAINDHSPITTINDHCDQPITAINDQRSRDQAALRAEHKLNTSQTQPLKGRVLDKPCRFTKCCVHQSRIQLSKREADGCDQRSQPDHCDQPITAISDHCDQPITAISDHRSRDQAALRAGHDLDIEPNLTKASNTKDPKALSHS